MELLKMKACHVILCIVILLSMSSPVSSFQFKDVTGKVHTLSDYQGRWVLVNFWATWCPPCLKEIPDLISLYESRSDIMIIGVAIDEADPGVVLEYAKSLAISYPTVIGDRRLAAQIDDISLLPSTYLYDPAGDPAARKLGLITRAEIEEFIQSRAKQIQRKYSAHGAQ